MTAAGFGRHRRWLARGIAAGVAALSIPSVAAATPLGYLEGYGSRAVPVTALTWGLLWISIAVVVIVTVLVLVGVIVRRKPGAASAALEPARRRGEGLKWIYYGVGLSSLVLFGSLVWTVEVLAKVNSPGSDTVLTVEVTGRQWWWQVRYLDDDPQKVFVTANEIHIPVGRPVRVKLVGADVIHSFWVPKLSGKTDAIPGQTNQTWLEADRPGRYRGQCTEYCGQQHAHMGFEVVAEDAQSFDGWLAHQRSAPASAATPELAQQQQLFEYRCGACHAVRGTGAGGSVAPDLTHLMSRAMLAAGTLDNTPANLSGWVLNPQAIKPGTRMPNLDLSGPELGDIRAYLETLQ